MKNPFQEEELRLRLALEKKRRELPHLYSQKFYKWSREYFESDNRMNLLCSANQVGKSSVNIRKCIHWATEDSLWPKLWQSRPTQFWYMYPSKDMATIEFDTKWESLLPQGEAKKSRRYGYEVVRDRGDIYAVKFNSGVSVYFKTYAQDKKYLQGASVYATFADEEMPESLFDEVMFRLSATGGYFHMVFTATLGQRLWYQAMEERGAHEKFVTAWKRQVPMHDCIEFEDGSEGVWSEEKIRKQELLCKNKNEILRRIYGRFVSDEGLKYPTFDMTKHLREEASGVPSDWLKFCAIDYGSGGTGHKAGVVFLAVRPDLKRGRVFLCWRGDGEKNTTAGDVVAKYLDLRRTVGPLVRTVYDPACKDVGEIASRVGVTVLPAKKGKQGEDILNTLFKNVMISIDANDGGHKLAQELMSLRESTHKQHARDDLVDCLRYVVSEIGWDFSDIGAEFIMEARPERALTEEEARRQFILAKPKESMDEEFEEWNELYGEA